MWHTGVHGTPALLEMLAPFSMPVLDFATPSSKLSSHHRDEGSELWSLSRYQQCCGLVASRRPVAM